MDLPRRMRLRTISDPAAPSEPLIIIFGLHGDRIYAIDQWGYEIVFRPRLSRQHVLSLFAGHSDFLARQWPGSARGGRIPFDHRAVAAEIHRLAAEIGAVNLDEMQQLGFPPPRRRQ